MTNIPGILQLNDLDVTPVIYTIYTRSLLALRLNAERLEGVGDGDKKVQANRSAVWLQARHCNADDLTCLVEQWPAAVAVGDGDVTLDVRLPLN
jgi:hypothetical protein